MEKGTIRYDQWIEESLRGVILRALMLAEIGALPGDHHFYITFNTTAAGVIIPKPLKSQNPKQMTIVLQHQYENLKVGDDYFEVTLRFGGKPGHLRIPLAAVTSFTDPSVNFALQFKDDGEIKSFAAAEQNKGAADAEGDDITGEVIALDAFRKK